MTSAEYQELLKTNPEALFHRINDLEYTVSEQQHEITKLQLAIHNSNKHQYGAKSEKLSSDQLAFTFEGTTVSEQKELQEEVVVERHTRTVQKGRKPLPGHLPRETITYEPEETHCPCCNKELVVIGETKIEELEKFPAQFKVIEHIRVKKACGHCKGAKVLIAPLPPSVIPFERSRPGAGLLADIFVNKYVYHLPLHRQEEMFRRKGIELKRQRMCDWLEKVVDRLLPLYRELKREILRHRYIHADETTIKVQDGEVPGKCHTGYLWGLLGPPNLVWFHYDKSRAASVIKDLLGNYKGAVHTDAYAGYNPIFIPDTCKRVACLAHIRRAFLEVEKTAQKEVARVLRYIAELYKLEKGVRTPEARLELRSTRSRKVLDELFLYLHKLVAESLPKSPLMKPLKYTLNQEAEVRRIFESGVYELDNNAIERQIRPVAIGRKNYMFAGSHAGAVRAAVLYSLLNSCKLNNVDPWDWLKDVIIVLGKRHDVELSALLPNRWEKRT